MTRINKVAGYMNGKIRESKDYASAYLSQRPYALPVIITVIGATLIAGAAALEFINTGSVNGQSYGMQINTTPDLVNMSLPESLRNLNGGIEINNIFTNSTPFPKQIHENSVYQGLVNHSYDRVSENFLKIMRKNSFFGD